MAFKADWDRDVSNKVYLESFLTLFQVKSRGTDLTTEATSNKTKPSVARTSKQKVNNFAPPSGTARLTEKNLKKMELEHAAAPS